MQTYNTQIKSCQNKGKSKYCMGDFEITPDDFTFYDKIKVPPPTFCPQCRMQRKYLWRNERTLYRRICDKTGESIVSMYAPDNRFPVFTIKEWWSDSWDPKDYGQDIDFTCSFFEQYKELQSKVPRTALFNTNCINSDYSMQSRNSKDVYLCVGAFESNNCYYSKYVFYSKDIIDVYRAEGKSNDHIYECINIHDCYNTQYCFLTTSSFDCHYSFDLKNCSNCFLSYNLRGQSYYFRNQKYSKEQYFQKINEFNLSSYADRQKLYEEWIEIVFEKALHKNLLQDFSTNSYGNYLFSSNNSENCFESENINNCKYVVVASGVTDTYDLYSGGLNLSLAYNSIAVTNCSNLNSGLLCRDSNNIEYCDSCVGCNELFACIGIKKGSYMILNKQYSKEDYFELKEKLIEHMKQTGEYGQFFPPDLSPFAYNETQAQIYMPLEKEEALELGYTWKDDMPGTYGKETLQIQDIPDTIEDTPDSITDEVLKCSETGRNYNIVPQELELYRRLRIPIPRLHPDVRYKKRIALRPDRKLYDSTCYLCQISIKVAYPENRRPTKIVCEDCYKREIL